MIHHRLLHPRRVLDRHLWIFACLAGTVGAAAAVQAAVTWNNLQFGGFASQGYLLSSANNYIGNSSDGTFDFREYGVNGSWSKGEWRIGAQAFGEKLGYYGGDRVMLDWAMVDFQPKQWLGMRAGRVKLPRGLYNESLDLDSVRPFVLLPQSIYDNRLRDFNSSFDGAMVYGNVELRRAGSIDYRLYYGRRPISLESGASDFFNADAPFPNLSIAIRAIAGGTLFWNPPVSGLRVGYSNTTFLDFNTERHVIIPAAHLDYLCFKNAERYKHDQVSVEYVMGDWTFAAEAARERARFLIGNIATETNATAVKYIDFKSEAWYASAARRVSRWLELGAYVSGTRDTYDNHTSAVIPPLLRQTDYALSARFDLSDHVLFKIEGHYLDGAGKVLNAPNHPNPSNTLDQSWTMLATKITFTF